MSYNSVVELVFDDFKGFVMYHLPHLLSTYETTQPDIKLPAPMQVIRGDYQITDIKVGMFPSIIVKPGQVAINPDGMDRPLVKNLLSIDLSYWIVNCLNASNYKFETLETLQRTNERYAWALMEIIDSPSYIPTQTSITNAIRRVKQFDWSIVETGNNVSIGAVFVDINLQIQVNRV